MSSGVRRWVLEVRSRCPVLHGNRDCSRQMALVMAILKAKDIKAKYIIPPDSGIAGKGLLEAGI